MAVWGARRIKALHQNIGVYHVITSPFSHSSRTFDDVDETSYSYGAVRFYIGKYTFVVHLDDTSTSSLTRIRPPRFHLAENLDPGASTVPHYR